MPEWSEDDVMLDGMLCELQGLQKLRGLGTFSPAFIEYSIGIAKERIERAIAKIDISAMLQVLKK